MGMHTARRKRESVVRPLAESLWFPTLFFLGFLFCYMLAFHSPAPHQVPVAVSSPAAAGRLQAALNSASPGGFDVIPEPEANAARHAVLDRTASAAYTAVPNPTLYVAKADGYSLEEMLLQVFTPIGTQHGGRLSVVDLAPTASGDTIGTGMFYLALAWDIPGYVLVMMLLRAVTVSRGRKILTILGVGAAFSVVGYFVALAMHVIPSDPMAIPIAFALVEAVALTSYGLAPFVKQFFPGVAMGLFVLLSMPSSGGTIPVSLVPPFFAALHPLMPMGNLVDALRGLFYFNGVGVGRPVAVLCAWIVFGFALIGADVLRQRHRLASENAQEVAEIAEPPVEDPALEMPQPTALPPRGHHFGGPTPMLLGRVSDQHDHPVPGATVTIIGGNGRQLVHANTDHLGEYAVTGLPQELVDIVVSAPGRRPEVLRVLVWDGTARRHDFVLSDWHVGELATSVRASPDDHG